jgi:hypothetical protein
LALAAVAVGVLVTGCFVSTVDGSLVITFDGELPDGVTAISYTVTGPDMSDFTGDLTPGSPEAIVLPIGENRRYTVIVDVDNGTPVNQYTATGTFSVIAGEVTEVAAKLFVSGSALIVPDYSNSRIVRLDTAAGENPQENTDTFVGPVDAEVGPDGRIYVLDSGDGTYLWMLNSFTDTGQEYVSLDDNADFSFDVGRALAIDTINRLVYYATPDTIYSQPLGGGARTTHTPAQALGISAEGGIKGLSADHDGNLYIAYTVQDGQQTVNRVAKLVPDPAGGTGTVLATHDLTTTPNGFTTYWDVHWYDGSVYVADNAGRRIVELTDELSFVDEYGTAYAGTGEFGPQEGEFLGPPRFVGHGNAVLSVADDDDTYGSLDRVVGIGDISGAGLVASDLFGTPLANYDYFLFP